MHRRDFLKALVGVAAGVLMTTRVQLGKLPSGDYGLRVVASDGATVIIDGTSNMFKIIASGGLGITGCNGTGTVCTSQASVSIATGLSVEPAHHMHVEQGGLAYNIPFNNATTGGGATNSLLITGYTDQSGTLTTVGISLASANQNTSGTTYVCRYYLFQEVAI